MDKLNISFPIRRDPELINYELKDLTSIYEETIEKIRLSKLGKKTGPQSEETCRKKSISLKGKNLGKQHTEEFKRQRSLLMTGVKRGPYKKNKEMLNG